MLSIQTPTKMAIYDLQLWLKGTTKWVKREYNGNGGDETKQLRRLYKRELKNSGDFTTHVCILACETMHTSSVWSSWLTKWLHAGSFLKVAFIIGAELEHACETQLDPWVWTLEGCAELYTWLLYTGTPLSISHGRLYSMMSSLRNNTMCCVLPIKLSAGLAS